jgi:DNA-binding transcriptional ArsR family regulator
MEPELFVPDQVRVVEDSQGIKAFSDPLRVRLLIVLAERAATNQQLADGLGEPQAKVLYHLRFLLDAGLIRLVETRVKGGNVEKYYRAVARNFSLRPIPQQRADIVGAELDAFRREQAASAAAYPDEQGISASMVRVSPEQATELFKRVAALIDEYDPDRAGVEPDDPDARPMTAVFLIFRNVDDPDAPQRGRT